MRIHKCHIHSCEVLSTPTTLPLHLAFKYLAQVWVGCFFNAAATFFIGLAMLREGGRMYDLNGSLIYVSRKVPFQANLKNHSEWIMIWDVKLPPEVIQQFRILDNSGLFSVVELSQNYIWILNMNCTWIANSDCHYWYIAKFQSCDRQVRHREESLTTPGQTLTSNSQVYVCYHMLQSGNARQKQRPQNSNHLSL